MQTKEVVDYYSKEGIAEQIFRMAKDREVAGVYHDGRYGQRPNILQFKNEVVEMAKSGITSFHYSVERWSNPMILRPENYSKLRIGWDLIIDIDSKLGIEEAKYTALLICNLFQRYSIKKYGIKFSGRRGFHICLPWESFPSEVDYKILAGLYPDIPRILASFIRDQIKDELIKELMKNEQVRVAVDSGNDENNFNPYTFVEVEKNWGMRHMFRAPYSFNEKTWLVSLPIALQELSSFSVEMAQPDIVEAKQDFLIYEENQAESLLTEAMDWYALHTEEKKKKIGKPIGLEGKIAEKDFPPCIKLILQGLTDARKRSMFTLINFLRTMNWTSEEIEERLLQWNTLNKPPLARSLVLSQLRYSQSKRLNCANCDSAQYFVDTELCRPDSICKGGTNNITIVNPSNYPKRKLGSGKKGLGLYKCIDCGSGFKNMLSLKMHKGRTH